MSNASEQRTFGVAAVTDTNAFSAAVEVVAATLYEDRYGQSWLTADEELDAYRADARSALESALPLLSKEIAEQIAAVIEARQSPYGPGDADDRYRFGVRDSAALARSFGGPSMVPQLAVAEQGTNPS